MVVRRTIKRYEWDSGTVSVCREREDSAETVEEDNMAVKTTGNPQREELKQKFVDRLQLECSVSPDEASDKQIYQVLSALMVEKLKHKRQHFVNKTNSVGGKSVYYLSMEFPEPVIQLAIEPKTKAGQEKMGIALAKLAEEIGRAHV